MDKKELEKSIEKVVLKMAMDPKNTEHYHELAKYYAMDNQYEKVISVYESLLDIDPKDMQTLLNLGSIWFYAKDYKKALSEDQLVATSYDATAEDTVFAADFILNRAKRAAESGQKVCLVVDSLDYLARAHNRTVEACKSKELSFGLSLATVQYIKNYFASARAFQQFGSLTIITATEEYSGDAFSDYLTKELLLVANSIVSLKKEGMDGLIFDFTKSGTEKGKMLLTEKELETYNRISDLISEGKEKDVQKALRTCATLDDFVLRIQNI